MVKPLVYLASPYSHDNPAVRLSRYRGALVAAAWLMRNGRAVFSPIVHSHPLVTDAGLPNTNEFWAAQDEAVLAHCSEMIVLCLDGAATSRGIASEMRFCREHGIPVSFATLNPDDTVTLVDYHPNYHHHDNRPVLRPGHGRPADAA